MVEWQLARDRAAALLQPYANLDFGDDGCAIASQCRRELPGAKLLDQSLAVVAVPDPRPHIDPKDASVDVDREAQHVGVPAHRTRPRFGR